MSGKGDKPRPIAISYEQFGDNWDNIFKKKPVRKDMVASPEIKNEKNKQQTNNQVDR